MVESVLTFHGVCDVDAHRCRQFGDQSGLRTSGS